jgi:hypothetical protein
MDNGNTFYVVRDLSIDRQGRQKDAIIKVVFGRRGSLEKRFPEYSIVLLSGYSARMQSWILAKFKPTEEENVF